MKIVNYYLFPLLALLLLLSSCGGEKPKKVAEEAINAEIEAAFTEGGDFERFYSYLSQKDREECTLDSFKKFYKIPNDAASFLELIPEAKSVIKVDDFKETITGETAVVTYKLTVPDTESSELGNFTTSDLQALAGLQWKKLTDLPEEFQNKIRESVQKNGVPTKEVVRQVNMIREGDSWKLRLNLSKQIADNKRIHTLLTNE